MDAARPPGQPTSSSANNFSFKKISVSVFQIRKSKFGIIDAVRFPLRYSSIFSGAGTAQLPSRQFSKRCRRTSDKTRTGACFHACTLGRIGESCAGQYPAAAVPAFWSRRRGTKSNVLCLNSWFTSLYIKGTEKQPYMGVQLFQAFGLTFRLAVTNAEECNDRGNVLKRQRVGIFCPQNTQ